jgi:hypothetical protein
MVLNPVNPVTKVSMHRAYFIMVGLSGLAACSATREPVPSSLFDGRYLGTRHAAPLESCATLKPDGTTSAEISKGEVTIPLFGPQSRLRGTVGADGRVHASGMWSRSQRYFPRMTVLNGQISDGILTGNATDMQCVTELQLHKIVAPPKQSSIRRKR